jgi:hypothetical protein
MQRSRILIDWDRAQSRRRGDRAVVLTRRRARPFVLAGRLDRGAIQWCRPFTILADSGMAALSMKGRQQ